MRYPIFGCVMIMLLSLRPTPARADLREWTSDDGKFKVGAELTGFDGVMVRLKKSDGTVIEVPIARLSAADRTFVGAWKKDAAELPASVVKFQKSLKSLREHEGKRLEQRIESIKLDIAKGKAAKPPAGAKVVIDAPPGLEDRLKKATDAVEKSLKKEAAAQTKAFEQEAVALAKTLEKRLELVRSDRPFVPRLSPKDFAIGQIGEFDDDLVLQMSKPGKDEARISIMFDELKFFDETARVPWVHVRIGRPDSFYLRGDIVAPLVNVERGGDRNSPTNRLLHKHVFEIVDKIPRGLISDFVLVPYPMDEVQAWLKGEDAKRTKKP